MNTLSILSKDASTFLNLFKQAGLPNLHMHTFTECTDDAKLKQSQILFGNPNMIAQAIQQGATPKWVQSSWAGNKPLLDLAVHDFQLSGIKGVFGQAMCEYVFTYLLYFARNVEGFRRAQARSRWEKTDYGTLRGKTLGIMGVGDIGMSVAKIAKLWGMHVKGLNRSGKSSTPVDEMYGTEQKYAFAQHLDYLICLLPDTPETTHLINHAFLSELPPHCVLVNAGRGSVIDDDALIGFLRQRKIRAAVLDVFDSEPLPSQHPFWQLENVIVTPHTAAESTPEMIAPIFIENYKRFVKGQSLNHLIDFDKGY